MSVAPLRSGALLVLITCPALAVSDTVVNALGLGVAALACAPIAALAFAGLRRWLAPHTQLAAALLLSAGVVGCAELLMRAYLPTVHAQISVFLALFAVNAAVAGALKYAQSGAQSVREVLKATAMLAAILLIMGVARELVGRGSILHGAAAAFGDWAQTLEAKVFRVDMGFLLGMLPPGAFIALALLAAALNWMGLREQRKGAADVGR